MPITIDKTAPFFPGPTRGIIRNMAPHLIPSDGLRDARNMVIQDGVFQPRPGFITTAMATRLTGAPSGAGIYCTTAGAIKLVIVTTSNIYVSNGFGGAHTDLSGGLTGADPTLNPARTTTMVLGSGGSTASYIIATNGKDAPKKWDGVAASVASVAGSPPLWTDITTLDDKIIGIIPPYQVQWGATRSIAVWPALNFKQLAETSDPCTAIRSGPGQILGTIYKRGSIWSIVPTGNTSDAAAFRFPFAAAAEGPANVHAVVEAKGKHYRLTLSGKVQMWDGTTDTWICRGVWPLVKSSIYPPSVVGWYDPNRDEICFSWQGLAQNANLQALLTISPPSDRDADYAGWISTLNGQAATVVGPATESARTNVGLIGAAVYVPIAGGQGEAHWADNNGLVTHYGFNIRSRDLVVLSTDTTTQVSAPIYGWWETGLLPMPNVESIRAESVETFAARGQAYGALNLQVVKSFTLGNTGEDRYYGDDLAGSQNRYGRARLVSLQGQDAANDIEPVRADVGVDDQGRFLGLRYSFTTADPTADHITRVPRFYGAMLKPQKRIP